MPYTLCSPPLLLAALLFAATPLVTVAVHAQDGAPKAIPAKIASTEAQVGARRAVERYFAAADSGDPHTVRDAFWSSGRVEGVLGGKFVSWTAEEFATRNFRGQPPANTAAITRTVEWLDISGPGAVARVKVNIAPDAEYWDYFILFEVDSVWKIGLKAFANPSKK